jgi:hypothetical protein
VKDEKVGQSSQRQRDIVDEEVGENDGGLGVALK